MAEVQVSPNGYNDIGNKPINSMSDREIAEETLYWLRETGKALAMIQQQGVGSIMKMMMGGKSKS